MAAVSHKIQFVVSAVVFIGYTVVEVCLLLSLQVSVVVFYIVSPGCVCCCLYEVQLRCVYSVK